MHFKQLRPGWPLATGQATNIVQFIIGHTVSNDLWIFPCKSECENTTQGNTSPTLYEKTVCIGSFNIPQDFMRTRAMRGQRMVKSETRRDDKILVRNPSPRLFGKKFRDSKKVKTNHAKTRHRDWSKTLLRFRDPAKIFWDPPFSRYLSPPLHKMGPTVFHPKEDLSSHLQMTLQRQRFLLRLVQGLNP